MTQEEKIKEAKRLYESANADQRYVLESLFPELKESKGERIWIINYLSNRILNSTIIAEKENLKKAIAWLENQGEQKPADKVEPKFHEDDWIVNKGHSYLIADIDYEQRRYLFEIGGYTHEQLNWEYIANADNKYHLWTIQDAKDGDVLCTYECDKPKIVFILKGTPKKHYALSYHCYCNIMYPHFASDSEKGCLAPNDEDVKPATKEQRDTLERAMHNAGYEWDAIHKQLKKIEQKPIAWSEEDKYLLDETIKHLEALIRITKKQGSAYSDEIQYYQRDIDWLKSLRPQSTWKPSEEEMKALAEALSLANNCGEEYAFDLRTLYKQLKKLREE